MYIHGKKRSFMLTVGAMRNISAMCPNGDIKEAVHLISGNNWKANIDFLVSMSHEMNKGYEVNLKFEDGDHVVDIITVEELETLRFDQFLDLQSEVMASFAEGFETKVETETSVKKQDPIQ